MYVTKPSSTPPSSKLNGGKTAPIIDMLQLQLLKFLALGMEINPTDVAADLVEADVVKPFETRPLDLAHAVVGDQEGFLPAHEDVLSLREVLVVEVGFAGLFAQLPPGGEPVPVLHVGFVGGAPGGVAGLESVFGADDFAVEVGADGRVFFGQACG